MPPEDAVPRAARTPRFSRWRIAPIALIVFGAAAFFAFDLHRYLSFEALTRHGDALMLWREKHEFAAVLLFIGVYVVAVALSVPGAIWLTVAGGFLFGPVAGTVYAVIAATLGACTVFLAARYLVGDLLRAKARPWIRKMEDGFREHALSYLMALRLLPIFPFWLVNLVPAFLEVPLRTFFIGTFIGIIPASFVYALLGNGLGAVIATGGKPDLGIVFKPEVLAALVALALLSLAPVFYRWAKSRRSRSRGHPGRQ